jgi:hypothetical protein
VWRILLFAGSKSDISLMDQDLEPGPTRYPRIFEGTPTPTPMRCSTPTRYGIGTPTRYSYSYEVRLRPVGTSTPYEVLYNCTIRYSHIYETPMYTYDV